MLSNKYPAEYFTEYFICSLVFLVSVFQDMRCESITEPQQARKRLLFSYCTNKLVSFANKFSTTDLPASDPVFTANAYMDTYTI